MSIAGVSFLYLSQSHQDELRVTSFWHLTLFSLTELSQFHRVFHSKTGRTMSLLITVSPPEMFNITAKFLCGLQINQEGDQTANYSWLYSLKTRIRASKQIFNTVSTVH